MRVKFFLSTFVLPFGCALLMASALAAQAPIGPKPVIEGFKPVSAPAGSEVEIFGNNFSPDYSVWLGTTELEVLLVTGNKIKVKIPDNAKTGRFVLKGRYIVESRDLFRVVEKRPPPRIDGFAPTEGPPGTEVKIQGVNFSIQPFENIVMLGNTQVTVKAASPQELTVVVPSNAVSGKFTVTVPGGGGSTSASDFTVTTPLTVVGFSPEFGPPGTKVTIFATGLSWAKAKDIAVTLGGKKVKLLTFFPEKIEVEIPKDAISAPFAVTLRGKGSVVTAKPFEVRFPPVVDSFDPVQGFPGTVVTLTGKNFGSSQLKAKVKLGDTIIKILTLTDTKIEVQIPQGASSGNFTVEIAEKGVFTTARAFDVWAPLALKSFVPERGEADTIVKIIGSGFVTDLKAVAVFIGNTKMEVVALTPTEISAKVPRGAVSGPIRVEVKGRGKVESAQNFIVIYPPVIAGFTPSSGQVGQIVTVKGKHFGFSIDDIRVWIGPEDKKQFCIVQQLMQDKLTCQVQPNTVSGPVTVHVKGMGKAQSTSLFEVEEPLAITGFSPLRGPAGTTVIITGTGFSPTAAKNQVKLGKVPVPVLLSDSRTLTVKIPPTAKVGGNFHVQVKGKPWAVMSATAFDVIVPVVISKISPRSGPVGTTVKIKGQGFGSDPQLIQVTLLGFYCTITSLTPNEVQVLVPPALVAGESEGKFQVLVNPGGIAESPVTFKVTEASPRVKAAPKERGASKR